MEAEACRLCRLRLGRDGLRGRLVTVYRPYFVCDIGTRRNQSGFVEASDYRLFSRLCDSIRSLGLLYRDDQMDLALFIAHYESWRRLDDYYGHLALYRSNDANHDLVKPDYAGLPEVLIISRKVRCRHLESSGCDRGLLVVHTIYEAK